MKWKTKKKKKKKKKIFAGASEREKEDLFGYKAACHQCWVKMSSEQRSQTELEWL